MIDPFAPLDRRAIEFDDEDIVVLCEGSDECAVVRHLTKEWPRPLKVGTKRDEKGLTWEKEFIALAGQIKLRRLVAVGFIFDAEKSASKAKNVLKSRCKTAGLGLSKTPLELHNSILDGASVKTVYLINPDGQEEGALESLFIPQIRAAVRWPCIERLLNCYDENDPLQAPLDKAIVRTFIAHSNGYNTSIKVALQDEILNCQGLEFEAIGRFLNLLKSLT